MNLTNNNITISSQLHTIKILKIHSIQYLSWLHHIDMFRWDMYVICSSRFIMHGHIDIDIEIEIDVDIRRWFICSLLLWWIIWCLLRLLAVGC